MRRVSLSVLAACLVFLCHLSAAQADILEVIPEKSLVVVIAKSADGAEANFRDMGERLFGDLPADSMVEKLLQQLKLRPTPAPDDMNFDPEAAAKASVIDRKGPLAIVVVVPAMDIPGAPVGVVLRVSDYKKFLNEVAVGVGAAAAEVTPDGTDVLKGERDVIFAGQLGRYAVVAQAEYVVKTFKAEIEKNLAASPVEALRQTYDRSDVTLYLNTDDVVKTFGLQIEKFKVMMQEQMKNLPPGGPQPMPMAPEKIGQLLATEVDFAVAFYRQLDALTVGLKFGASGLRVASVYQPVPDTTLARLAGRIRPSKLGLLGTLDGPALAAAGWDIDPEVMNETTRVLNEFLAKSGLMEDEGKLKRYIESSRKMMSASGGQGALVWLPPGEGKGLIRLVYILSLRPNANMREAIKENIESSADFMAQFQVPMKIESRMDEAVEAYRNCTIDKVVMTFQSTADEDDPQTKQMLELMKLVYGPEILGFLTQANDKFIYTVGYPDSDVLKAQVDKVLDDKTGDVAGQAAFQSAVAGLPAARAGVMMISISSMLKSFMAKIATRMEPGAEQPIRDIQFEKPSGIGMSVGPAQKGIAVHVNVPMEEMQNIKTFFEEMTRSRRKQAYGASSMNNVRMLLLASIQYAMDHDGAFPPDFETLLKLAYLTAPKVFIAPASGDEVRADYPGELKNATMADLKLGPENCSYVFVWKARHSDPPNTIVIYEKKPFTRGGRIVGFNDGHVEFIPEEKFQKRLAEQNKRRDAAEE